ncbi:isoquinoline 1-oxidoreductase subunit alpha [uncultured Gammaproteobacteria bacterium]
MGKVLVAALLTEGKVNPDLRQRPMPRYALTVNRAIVSFEVEAETPLLWVLRDTLALTGTKFGCGAGLCGACTVLIKGVAVRACTVTVSALDPESEITTIEGLSATGIQGLPATGTHPVQAAWLAEQVPQCGYCQPGMILAATALLARSPDPTDAEIDQAMTNLCRCGSYERVRKAIHRAATKPAGANSGR